MQFFETVAIVGAHFALAGNLAPAFVEPEAKRLGDRRPDRRIQPQQMRLVLGRHCASHNTFHGSPQRPEVAMTHSGMAEDVIGAGLDRSQF